MQRGRDWYVLHLYSRQVKHGFSPSHRIFRRLQRSHARPTRCRFGACTSHHKSPCCAVEDLEVRTSCFIEDLVDVIRRPPKLDRKGDGYALRLQLVRVVLY